MRVRYYDSIYENTIMAEVVFRDKSDANRALLMITPQDEDECSAIVIAEKRGKGPKAVWYNVSDNAYVNVT